MTFIWLALLHGRKAILFRIHWHWWTLIFLDILFCNIFYTVNKYFSEWLLVFLHINSKTRNISFGYPINLLSFSIDQLKKHIPMMGVFVPFFLVKAVLFSHVWPWELGFIQQGDHVSKKIDVPLSTSSSSWRCRSLFVIRCFILFEIHLCFSVMLIFIQIVLGNSLFSLVFLM